MKKRIGLLASVLFLCFCATLGAQEFSLQATPGVSIPIGSSTTDLYRIGGGLELTGAYSLPFAPWLAARASLDYSMIPTLAETNLSMLTLSAGAGVSLNVISKLSLQAAAGAGYGLGFYEGSSGGSLYVSAEAGAAYSLTPTVALGLGAAYRHYFSQPTPFYQGLRVNLGSTFKLGGSGRKARIQIYEIQFDPIFPVFYKHYDDHPLGGAVIQNGESGAIENVTVSLFVKQYMDKPKECAVIEELKAGEEQRIPLYALFTDQVLTVTEGTKVTADVQIRYTYAGQEQTAEASQTLRLYDRNAMTWDDDRKAAAFITAKDPDILQFSKNVAGTVRRMGSQTMNLNFRTALGIFESLKLYGVNYVIDPQTPYAEFSEDKFAVDYLQFPRQTLAYKAGDCDDLSILNCALLESIGIETAFITVPGHILIAFSLGIDPEEAKKQFKSPEDLIFAQDEAWVPLEITMVQDGFLEAWREGAKVWREGKQSDTAAFFPVHDAWKEYEPVGLQGEAGFEAPSVSLLTERYTETLNTFIQRQIGEQVAVLKQEIQKQQDAPRLVNKLGILYGRYGLMEKAVAEFERAAGRNYAPAIINLGNVAFLEKDYLAALDHYERAEDLAPRNPLVLLGLARAHFELENFGLVKRSYSAIQDLDPALAEKFAYLISGDKDSARAASTAVKQSVVWDEEQ